MFSTLETELPVVINPDRFLSDLNSPNRKAPVLINPDRFAQNLLKSQNPHFKHDGKPACRAEFLICIACMLGNCGKCSMGKCPCVHSRPA